MLSFKHSISRKFIRLFFVVLLLTSVLLSTCFYLISINTINDYVIPQIDKNLNAAAQDTYKNLNASHAQRILQNDEQSATTFEYYFQDKRKQHDVETIFLLDLKEGQATVLAADHGSKLKLQDKLNASPVMEQASKGKSGLSDIYSDSHGIHKTAYIGIPGSPMVIGISSDMGFVKDKMNSILWTSALVTVLALIVGLLSALFMSRRIARPIRQIADYSSKLAEGDFTRELTITGKDEVGLLADSFRTMNQRLKEMIGQVLKTSVDVIADSNDLKERVDVLNEMADRSFLSVMEIDQGSASIASSASDNSRAMDEINMGVQQIAASAGEVTEQISEAADEASGGNEIAQSAVEQMRLVEQAASQSLKQFQAMSERSQMIGGVVQGITEISKQIHMLSLNASIEAARAGEHGRGFSVVAGEVRKLSEQTRNATNQISEFLLQLQEDMHRSVAEMDHVHSELGSGVDKVDEAGEAFNHLLDLIQKINLSIQSVSAAAEEISAGTEEVSASVEETAQITAKSQVNADALSHSSERQRSELNGHSRTVEHLQAQANKLREAVQQFKIS